ncbi:unnamed protein product [Macrosiphum euphorbiae]|uniref:Post-SET domain-containing protein n=1 Tax=Macrosiphum euphorbiae TaxID=13131 RepID=A0AAV0XCB0_9HEMI|nr:unnamed protein product [Macrosiphum euphorbiae]
MSDHHECINDNCQSKPNSMLYAAKKSVQSTCLIEPSTENLNDPQIAKLNCVLNNTEQIDNLVQQVDQTIPLLYIDVYKFDSQRKFKFDKEISIVDFDDSDIDIVSTRSLPVFSDDLPEEGKLIRHLLKYVHHKNIRLVCGESPSVNDDVPENIQEFVKEYLQKYPERRMVKFNKIQVVRTELHNLWCLARVKNLDASSVQLKFIDIVGEHTEWMYRGSNRLPWVAYFALSNIPAGTELAWNYNYMIGSMKHKRLMCHCGSKNCKGTLL